MNGLQWPTPSRSYIFSTFPGIPTCIELPCAKVYRSELNFRGHVGGRIFDIVDIKEINVDM